MSSHHLLFIKVNLPQPRQDNQVSPHLLKASAHSSYDTFTFRTIDLQGSPPIPPILNYYPYVPDSISRYFYPLWLRLGLLSWKIFALIEELQRYELNSWILYHDYNYLKYPVYLHNIRINPLFLSLTQADADIALFTEGYKPLCIDVSHYHFLLYSSLASVSNYSTGLWSGALAFRNNQRTREFLQAWATMISPTNFLVPLLSPGSIGDIQMVAPEQSMLTMLYHSYRQLAPNAAQPKLIYTRARKMPSNKLVLFMYFAKHYLSFLKTLISKVSH